MASAASNPSELAAEPSEPQNIPSGQSKEMTEAPLSSTPLELSTLESKNRPASVGATDASSANKENQPLSHQTVSQPATSDPLAKTLTASSTEPASLDRKQSTAIGPSSDQPMPIAKDNETIGPTLMITLLLTDGARHPFKLDSKYLNKRNVNVDDNDPFNLSVYTLKELILREWREEWEQKPSSPSSIRLISFGKLLDDKAPLKDSKFSHDSPNVVHMTIKPQEIVDEEDAKAAKGSIARDREGAERTPGCRCVIL